MKVSVWIAVACLGIAVLGMGTAVKLGLERRKLSAQLAAQLEHEEQLLRAAKSLITTILDNPPPQGFRQSSPGILDWIDGLSADDLIDYPALADEVQEEWQRVLKGLRK